MADNEVREFASSVLSHWVGGNRKRQYIDERRAKIVRNRVFDCHLSPGGRQKAIENTVLAIFDPRSSIVKSGFDCRLPDVFMLFENCY